MMPELLFASTTPGLEPALELEARLLGLTVRVVPGGAELSGPSGSVEEACLHLRTASHVLLRLGTFPARDEKALARGLGAIPLARCWDGRRPVALKVSSRASRLQARQVAAAAERAWRAATAGKEDGAAALLHVRLQEDVCTVSADASGELLHRRGYRQEVSRAPLRETLAAGMLLLAGYRGDEPLWDPMCGSGTLPIEAALMARRRAPGAGRSFAFQGWPSFDPAAWAARLERARAAERAPPFPIHGTDLHAGSLGVARRNARRAGVQADLELARADVAALRPPPGLPPGLVVANLPYGKRVGDAAGLRTLYDSVGRTLRSAFAGWRAALLAADRALEPALGLEPAQVFTVDNGGIRCRLLIARVRPGGDERGL